MGIKYDPNSAPNKVFTHRISGIEHPLTSLNVCIQKLPVNDGLPKTD
jgi:hypothetical protein